MENLRNYLILALVVVLGLGVFIGWKYTEALNEKNRIGLEKIVSDERIKQQELRQEQEKQTKEGEMEDRDYAAKQKKECLGIYEAEGKKWNNVRNWRYNETEDDCFIRYKDPEPKTEAKCDEMYPKKDEDGDALVYNFLDNLMCKDGEFENVF